MFLVVSRSDAHFGLDVPFGFGFAHPIGRTSKTARPKSGALGTEFAHPWFWRIVQQPT